jgi:hypothetical protein
MSILPPYIPAVPASNAVMWYLLKEYMKSLGWTVPRSGDGGATYNGAGDCITSGAVLATLKAWFELLAPDGSVAVVYQTGSGVNTARVKFTWGGGFTAGSPSATQVSATTAAGDEATIIGGGTDAAPTYAAVCASSGGNINAFVVADDSPPYAFGWGGTPTGGADGLDFLFYFDPLVATDADDTAPSVVDWAASFAASGAAAQITAVATAPFGWIGKGLGGGAIVRIPAETLRDGSATAVPSGLNRTFYSAAANCELFPLSYGRRATESNPDGWKGRSTLFNWVGSAELTGTRLTTDPEGDEWITADDLAIPWDGTAIANDPSAGLTRTAHYRSLDAGGSGTPVVTLISPTEGEIPGGLGVARLTNVVLTITGADLAVVWCQYANRAGREIVHDGTNYVAPFAGTKVGDLYTFCDTRGWQAGFVIDAEAA